MRDELLCPFCNGELVGTIGHPICRNQNCVMCDDPMPQDLLEELTTTKKKLDDLQKDYNLAVQHAKTMTETCLEYKAKLDIAIGGITYMRNNCFDYAADYMDYADGILEQIKDFEYRGMSTGLKDKIEFPEYNDNLLEEFDKQFFENEQDDDLTETALEQKDK